MNDSMRRAALAGLDAQIADLTTQLNALHTSRRLLSNGTAGGPDCNEGPSGCRGKVHTSTCPDCAFEASRCVSHGGGRTAGGIIAGHRRFKCEA